VNSETLQEELEASFHADAAGAGTVLAPPPSLQWFASFLPSIFSCHFSFSHFEEFLADAFSFSVFWPQRSLQPISFSLVFSTCILEKLENSDKLSCCDANRTHA
jgi:hypothetical protein